MPSGLSFCRARCSRWWCVRRCRLTVGMPTGTRRLAISQAPAYPTSTRPRGSGAAKRTAVPARAQRNWVDRRRACNPAGMAKTGLAGSAPRRPHRDPGTPVATSRRHQRTPAGSGGVAPPRRHAWKSDRADPGFTPGSSRIPSCVGSGRGESTPSHTGFSRAHPGLDGRRTDRRTGCARSGRRRRESPPPSSGLVRLTPWR